MSNHIEKYTVHVDSIDRVSGTTDDFTVLINFPVKNVEYTHVSLLNAVLVKSWYMIDEPYNYINLIENSTVIKIYIDPGNYDVENFCVKMTTLLNQYSANNWVYTIEYLHNLNDIDGEPDLSKFKITCNHNFSLLADNTIISGVFGLTINQQETSTSNILISPNVINFQPVRMLFLKSDICNNCDKSVLKSIVVGNQPYSTYINVDVSDVEMASKKFESSLISGSNIFRFYLTDNYDQTINLHGINISLTLVFYAHPKI